MKKILLLFLSIMLILPMALTAFNTVQVQAADNLAFSLSGRILLQVQENGESWYVNPLDKKRFYMGRPDDAFALMRCFGLGITNNDLNRIEMGYIHVSGNDSDNDGLPDNFELSQGTNIYDSDTDHDGYSDYAELIQGFSPLNSQAVKNVYDQKFTNSLKGRILLQVEGKGEAWYVNPVDGKRYYLGRPLDAFNVMRKMGLGITNADLSTIPVGYSTCANVKIESVCSIPQCAQGYHPVKVSDPCSYTCSANVTPPMIYKQLNIAKVSSNGDDVQLVAYESISGKLTSHDLVSKYVLFAGPSSTSMSRDYLTRVRASWSISIFRFIRD